MQRQPEGAVRWRVPDSPRSKEAPAANPGASFRFEAGAGSQIRGRHPLVPWCYPLSKTDKPKRAQWSVMDFDALVRRRRMVRNYLDRPVARDVIERIVERARKGPSAGFSQGLYFVVVTDEATRRELAQLAGEDDYVKDGMTPWISRAPVHVVVCVSEEDYHARYREPDKLADDGTEIEWPVPYWWIDAGATLMLLLLAAVDEGLGAGFFGVHRLEGITDLLGIPANVRADRSGNDGLRGRNPTPGLSLARPQTHNRNDPLGTLVIEFGTRQIFRSEG